MPFFSSAGGVVFSKYSAVHLYCFKVRQDHPLALAGKNHRPTYVPFSLNTCMWSAWILYLFNTLIQSKMSVFVSAGGLCPTVDPHVLLVPRCPLLHHLVSPLPALHRHHRWAAENSHHHGHQLDDHRCPSSHLWGEQFKQKLTLFTVTRRGTIKHRFMKLICFLSLYFISCCRAFVLNSYLWGKKVYQFTCTF